MLLFLLVMQETTGGIDPILLLVPVVCCLLISLQSRGEKTTTQISAVDESWYTTQDIETAYKSIEKATSEWREEAMRKVKPSFLKRLIGIGNVEERFVKQDAIPPSLYKLNDISGPIYFELTKVQGGGTVVKTSYNAAVKNLIAKFKASLPIIIPAQPGENRCKACGKPLLPEFKLCPYCGEKNLKE